MLKIQAFLVFHVDVTFYFLLHSGTTQSISSPSEKDKNRRHLKLKVLLKSVHKPELKCAFEVYWLWKTPEDNESGY